jgi:hypothetical protein
MEMSKLFQFIVALDSHIVVRLNLAQRGKQPWCIVRVREWGFTSSDSIIEYRVLGTRKF